MIDESTIATALHELHSPAAPDLLAAATAGGRRRVRRRRALLTLTAGGAVVAAVLVAVAMPTGSHAPPARPLPAPVAGPTAQQLAHGRWVVLHAPPLRLCDPVGVSDGRRVAVVEYGYRGCRAGVAIYNAHDNQWTRLPRAPLPSLRTPPVLAWGGGRLAVLDAGSGFGAVWSARIGWQRLPRIPVTRSSTYPATTATWVGGQLFVAIAGRDTLPQSFVIEPGTAWKTLPAPPDPAPGFVQTLAAVPGRSPFTVLATVAIHRNDAGSYFTAYPELLRLTGSQWTTSRLPNTVPRSGLRPAGMTGAVLVAGSSCPVVCTMPDFAAAIVTLSGTPSAREVHPPPFPAAVLPAPEDVTGGGDTVVVTYPQGAASLGGLLVSQRFRYTNQAVIWDVSRDRWIGGPTAPADLGTSGTFWTAAGVVSLDPNGGWLLRPGR